MSVFSPHEDLPEENESSPYGQPEGSREPFTPFSTAEDLNALQGIEYVMPPALEAFIDLYSRPHLRYAHTMLGDKPAAITVVRRCYSHLALNWEVVLRQESPEGYAWRLLKERVELHARITTSTQGHSPCARPGKRAAIMQRTARATLEAMRQQLKVIESPLGLYTAIAALPERQYDVIVLHYVLGYPTEHVAHIMGIRPDTVRGHRRSARERIASKLGPNILAGDKE
ncbi:sigma-70 family RNA polymerase sigma factor [Streptomyces beigongshangae]|uniref:sigma-70 family RNA polymerase sigma factor n=1 Tax=Streptomyces beigongshangae TaxID=2841597 RepID=UPI0021A3EE65|nr:sigma-70 family RNA polymerase sigma factor [Streptomyces sp. REN17]